MRQIEIRHGSSRYWSLISVALILSQAGLMAASAQQMPNAITAISCPPGTTVAGAAPPRDFQLYCQSQDSSGNSVRSGPYLVWHKNGRLRQEGQFRDGLPDGMFVNRYENEQRESKLQYRDGKLEGHAIYWHANGRKAAEGDYRYGLQQDVWLFWNEDGQQTRQAYRDARSVSSSLHNPASGPHLQVDVDPRIELLSAVLSLTDWPNNGPWSRFGSPYERDMQVAFASFKGHAAVRQLGALTQEDFAFDAPVEWILHYCSLPELRLCSPLSAEVLKRGGGQSKLDSLAEAFRDFARQAKFMEFYKVHKPLYDQLVAEYRSQAPGDDAIALLEAFYGERKSAYTAVIAPMFGGGNYGVRVKESNGEHIYNIGAPHEYREEKYGFDPEELTSVVFHEFGHSFVNPVVDSFPAADKHATWYPTMGKVMQNQGYGEWHTVIYELMVRANEVRLLQLQGNRGKALDSLQDYTNDKGFVWLPYLLKRLEEYEADRKTYPTYKSFIGRMFAVLDETQPVFIGGRLRFLVPVISKDSVPTNSGIEQPVSPQP